MGKGDIRISEKHGLNPSMLKCPCCGGDAGIALQGRMKDDAQAPREMLDLNPCQNCTAQFDEYKTMGFVLFVIRDEYDERSAKGEKLPVWPFFKECHVIKHEAAAQIFNTDLSKGAAFIPVSVARQIGLEEPTTPLAGTKT